MGNFAPKTPVQLDPPKEDPFTKDELAKYDGLQNEKIYLAIKGVIFDVSRNRASYGPDGGYRVFVGKDASRGLAKSSLNPEDAIADYSDLPEKELKTLNDWFSYFSQRYNIVGKLID